MESIENQFETTTIKNLDEEIWIPMDGNKYNKADYELSNYGKIRKIRKNTKWGKYENIKISYNTQYGFHTKMMFNSCDENRNIIINKTRKLIYLKHIIAYYFVLNPNNYKNVIYLDQNDKNLYYENLYWISENEVFTRNNNIRVAKYNDIRNKLIENNNKILLETDNIGASNFVPLGIINDKDFSKYSISKDGKSIINTNRSKLYLKSKLKNKGGYVYCNLVDAYKGTRNGEPMLMHKLIHTVLKGGNYNDEIDHLDQNKTNNNLDNLEAVTSQENSNRANGTTFYKVDPITREIIETYKGVSELFPVKKDQQMVRNSFYMKRSYRGAIWRKASEENNWFTIVDNKIIDSEKIR